MVVNKNITKMIFVVLLLFFLSGCYDHDEAEFECQISVDSMNSDCSALAGRMRACQILDMTYDTRQGVSSYCTGSCLSKSKFLDSVPKECITVSVAYSRFSENAGKPILLSMQLGSIDEEDENCDPLTDRACCIDEGKCWIDNNCKSCSEGECQFKSDCSSYCKGNLIQDRDCNLKTATCEDTFTNDCSNYNAVILDETHYLTCKDSECVVKIEELQTRRDEASKLALDYTLAAEDVRSAVVVMDDIALGALEGLFAETLQTTFEALNVISGNWIQLLGEAGASIVLDGLTYVSKGDDEVMTKPDLFRWAIDNRDVLRLEEESLVRQADKTKELVKQLDQEIAKLN